MKTLVWQHLPCDDAQAASLASALDLHPTVARLLCLRGFDDPETAQRFLQPSLDHLHDPFKLTGMMAAVERLEQAIARRERIAIHGDYDVDGITSTVILRRALEMLGGDVIHFIPERLKDGYGLQPAAIERLRADGVSLIVSVDCGIRGIEAAKKARDLAVDLIITDHHEPGTELPDAVAVLNPKRHDCSYPDKSLAGVGVALKVVQALCSRAGRQKWLPAFVKIAAIGTLADVVPLVGENRVIARFGLASLSTGPHTVGLRALLDCCGLTGKTIDSYQVAFMLAPRVNAAGRMSTPDIATRLLLATDSSLENEARTLAQQLNDENLKRQQEEADLVAQARKAIETDPAVGAHNVLVVGGPGWHRGVIGIAASKLVDTYHKPSIVLSIDGDVAHGSCRSIPDFDMLDALERCSDLFVKFGGHRQAAGLTMESARVPEFRQRINAWADEVLHPDQLRPRLRIDAPLSLNGITHDLVRGLDALGPFGMGNPRPVFHAAPVEIVDGPRTLKERHLKMTFSQQGRRFRAIAWRAAERAEFLEKHRSGVNLAFSLDRNEYQGETYLELNVCDIRSLDGDNCL
jgi:single-stranded-DNA-specific exonuclease